MPVNIRTIAQMANVSVATVSRVLSNKGYVAPETRQRIIAIMDELNYIPGTIANRGDSLGIIVSKQVRLSGEGYELQLISGISEVAFMAAQTVVLVPSDLKKFQRSELLHLQRTNGLGGLICIAPPDSVAPGFFESIVESGIPHVVLPDRIDIPGVNWISPDNRRAASDAMNYLLSLGHRRIAFINSSNPQAPDRRDRLEGYRESLNRARLTVDPALIVESFADNQELEARLRAMRSLPAPPTAILAASYTATLRTYALLKDLGISVPEDISLVGFGDSTAYEYQAPPLTAIRHPFVDIGREATRYLLSIKNGRPAAETPFQMVLPSFLVIRRSAQPPREG